MTNKNLYEIYSEKKDIETILSIYKEKIQKHASYLEHMLEDIIDDTVCLKTILNEAKLSNENKETLYDIQDIFHNDLSFMLEEGSNNLLDYEEYLEIDEDEE